jgi:hypothetical protein
MSTSTIPQWQLRAGQGALTLAAVGMLFFPWLSYPRSLMQGGFEWMEVAGISTPFGSLGAAMILASLGTSTLEALLRRSARFVHVGLFSVTLLIGVIVHLLSLLQESRPIKVHPEFDIFVAVAMVTFAATAMLSPSENR